MVAARVDPQHLTSTEAGDPNGPGRVCGRSVAELPEGVVAPRVDDVAAGQRERVCVSGRDLTNRAEARNGNRLLRGRRRLPVAELTRRVVAPREHRPV